MIILNNFYYQFKKQIICSSRKIAHLCHASEGWHPDFSDVWMLAFAGMTAIFYTNKKDILSSQSATMF